MIVRVLFLSLALSVLGLAAAPFAAPPAMAQNAMLVRVDTVKRVPLTQTVPVIGRLVAQMRGEVAARINGPVESFDVEVGDRVEAGQVIARLNATSLQARRDLFAGKLNETRAKLSVKKAELALARQEFKRLERLKKSAAFSQGRFEDSRQKVAIAKAEMREAESAIAGAKADLQLAEINVYNAEVRASYAGVVTERLTEAGAYVQVGQAVIRVIADQSLEIEADVPFQHLAVLTPGTGVWVTLDDRSRHSAVVRAVIPSENPLTRTRTVRFVPNINISETTRPLAHDQSVTLEIPIGTGRNVLTVHKDAIVKRRGQDMVYVVQGDDALPRPVRLGAAVGSRFEVLDGLKDGDKVVVRGNERLKPGDKVRIIGAS